MRNYIEVTISLTILFIFFNLSAYAQNQDVTGMLTNEKGEPVPHASVTLRNKDGKILSFSTTTASGSFIIKTPVALTISDLFLEVNYLGFKKVREFIIPGKLSYLISMQVSETRLPEVKISNRPLIASKKDTLSYDVNSFSHLEDRSIGDVLKHMPGIEVSDNGEIKYNGKSISNLYIGGDDLLDGRYNLGTRTIPKGVIQTVDVMQHYQPIKVLKNKSFTDNVAINLIIKKDAALTLSGQALLGAGLPEQYETAVNTILFNKKVKMLNTISANNKGDNYREDLLQFGNTNSLNSTDQRKPGFLLFAGTAGSPDLPSKYYYQNNSAVLNANNLYNFKNELQLKSNVQILYDKNQLNYQNSTDYFLNNDTVSYKESQYLINKPLIINTTVKALVNKDSYYLNDDLKINYSRENHQAEMSQNNILFNQQLIDKISDFSNDLRFTPALKGKNILDLIWYGSYYKNPQRLLIDQGLNKDVLNNGIPYQGIDQTASTPSWFNSFTAAYKIINKLLRQNYQAGYINEHQNINSALEILDETDHLNQYASDHGNALKWNKNRIFINSFYELKKNKWEFLLNLPLYFQNIKFIDKGQSINETKKDVFFNPSARVKYFVNTEDYLQVTYNYTNTAGNVDGVYKGTILVNYRSLEKNSGELQRQDLQGTGIFYNFQRSVIMLFINGGVNYSKVKANTIQSSFIENDIQQDVFLPLQNNTTSLTARLGISKYLFFINTNTSLKSSWSNNVYNQVINHEIIPYRNINTMLTFSMETKVFKKIRINYTSIGNWKTGKQLSDNSSQNKIVRYDQKIILGYNLNKNLFFNFNHKIINSKQTDSKPVNYLFSDFNFRYKIIKMKADFEFDLSNMMNVKLYENYSIYSNRTSADTYNLRGRMAMFKLTFNF